jgi:predicted DNA-binding transcriptional regulator AlpA
MSHKPAFADTTAGIEPLLVDFSGLERMGIRYSNAWLLELEKRGEFPKRISVGARKVAWVVAEVKAAIAKAAAERETTAAARGAIVRRGNSTRAAA